MLCSTHLKFSKIVISNIIYSSKFNLKVKCFKFGNIKPDLMLNFKNIPHNFNCSADYIMRYIDAIIDDVSKKEDLESREFAVNLGVINHYIADFFCLPHNKNLYNRSLIPHLVYEQKIDSLCRRIKGDKLRKYLYANGIVINNESSISEYICSRYNNYKKQPRKAGVDILFAIQMCIVTNNYIISKCLERCGEIAA